MAKVIGDLALAMAGLGESVPVLVNGAEVAHILAQRNAAGDLRLHLVTAVPEVAAVGPPAEDTDRTEDIPDEVAEAENPAEVEKAAVPTASQPQYLDDANDTPL